MKLSYFSLLLLTFYVHTSNSMLLDPRHWLIEKILEYKSNPDLPIDIGFGIQMPPLHAALLTPQLNNLIAPLLQAGANPNNKFHFTQPMQFQLIPLHCVAGCKDRISYLRLLLEYKADVNITDEEHKTPLMVAAKYGDYEGAQILLSHGANPNIQDQDGNTALHEICQHYVKPNIDHTVRQPIIKLLLHHEANLLIKNKEGKTAVDTAQENGFDALVQFMQKQKIRFARQLLIILKKASITTDITIAQRIADFVYSSHA